MKKNIAKYTLYAAMVMIIASHLPWLYMTIVYPILRYGIMACMATAALCTFSLDKLCSKRFMRLFIVCIAIVAVEAVCFRLLGLRFVLTDLSELMVACLCIVIGIGIDEDIRFWSNVCYFYTVGLIIMTVINCFYFAKGLYIPEYYLVDKGKNQIGGLLAICAAADFFFAIHLKSQRTHFMTMFIIIMLLLLIIRARSDFFAVLACVLLLTAKDGKLNWKWGVKPVLTVLGIMLICYILYSGFIGDELKTFMVGGKRDNSIEQISSHRWERNYQGINYFLQNPIHGEEKETSGILLIHNYLLLRLVRYGIWSFPIIGFYLFFGIKTICVLFRQRRSDIREVGYVACTIPLIVSLAEPNFPYGPGTVQMLAFVLLGASLQAYDTVPERHKKPKEKKILHLSNDFIFSKVHSELYRKLDDKGVNQIVYTPIRKKELEGRNRFDGKNTAIIYSYILRPLHRIFFNLKIDKITRDIVRKIDLSEVSYIHASNLFSDGAVALALKKRYGIPYIVAVRNTDINVFLKYTPYLWWVHRAVIKEADRVIFITPTLQRRLASHWTLRSMQETLQSKGKVICNGLNDYWLSHLHPDPAQRSLNHSIIYVGNFDRNKNVVRLADAVLQLAAEIPDVRLNLVGSGNRAKALNGKAQQHPGIIVNHGPVYDKEKLQELYRQNSVFAMPSLHETFGLVYVEALSQGLSVLYSENEGIDGLFDENVGESVTPTSTESIVNGLRSLLMQPQQYRTLPPDRFAEFNWSDIADEYVRLYEDD